MSEFVPRDGDDRWQRQIWEAFQGRKCFHGICVMT